MSLPIINDVRCWRRSCQQTLNEICPFQLFIIIYGADGVHGPNGKQPPTLTNGNNALCRSASAIERNKRVETVAGNWPIRCGGISCGCWKRLSSLDMSLISLLGFRARTGEEPIPPTKTFQHLHVILGGATNANHRG